MTATIPQTDVDICNLALDHLSQEYISSIDSPTTDPERVCARWYHVTRKALLREFVWNFATKYAPFARAAAGTYYADAYTIPTDFVRLCSLGEDVYNPIRKYQFSYISNARCVEMDNEGASTVPVRYVFDFTDVPEMDPSFITCLSLKLAINMSYKFSKRKSLRDELSQLLGIELPAAIGVDGQERPPIRVERSRMLADRVSSGGLRYDNRYYPSDEI